MESININGEDKKKERKIFLHVFRAFRQRREGERPNSKEDEAEQRKAGRHERDERHTAQIIVSYIYPKRGVVANK